MVDVKSLDQGQLTYVIERLRQKYASWNDTNFVHSLNLESLQDLLTILLNQDAQQRQILMDKIFARMKDDILKIEEMKYNIMSFSNMIKEAKQEKNTEQDLEKLLEDL